MESLTAEIVKLEADIQVLKEQKNTTSDRIFAEFCAALGIKLVLFYSSDFN